MTDPILNTKLKLSPPPELNGFLQKASSWLLQQQINGQFWDYHAYLGSHFLAQYSLCLKWLGETESDVNDETIKAVLAAEQLTDGSWYQVKDLSEPSGDLNATIFNYWFLKATGTPFHDPQLTRAREFILKKGGIESSSLFTKTFLALFGGFPWGDLSRVPYVLFAEGMPSNYKSFSQWVIPHLMPMAYLRSKRVAKNLGEEFQVRELWVGGAPKITIDPVKANTWPAPISDFGLMRKMLSLQQPKGSWGGYTVSTLLTVMSIDHFKQSGLLKDRRLDVVIKKGLSFIDQLYVHAGPGAYQGCLMDGHYWDTLLSLNALIECGVDALRLKHSRDYIIDTQLQQGGFPYGFDFEYAPDVDDTAEAMMMMAHWPDQKERIEKAGQWLLNMQNRDGGFGAFDKNNVGNPFLKVMTARYNDSVDLFDDSSADSTGHVLDALSLIGHTRENSTVVQRGIDYLKKSQEESSGAWVGRWAVNYLFGTCCALVGLIKAGEPVESLCIQKGLNFLIGCQNSDGGYGETTRSYVDPLLAGFGPSTPSQSAWVLWTLSHAGLAHSEAATRAAHYLIENFEKNSGWRDDSVTGTGHPGLLYMVYPSYSCAFPLMALGVYRNKLKTANFESTASV